MDVKTEFNTVKQIVEQVLSENPQARNNDLILALEIWQKKQQIKVFIPYDKINEMINFETIRRTRQVIQNTLGRWLPTDPLISFKRRIREEKIREYFANNEWYLTEWSKLKYGIKDDN